MKQFFNRLMVIAICMTILPASAIMAQRTITGVILSSDDQEPLIGASVSVSETQLKNAGSKAKTLGTVTDIDGQFSLTIPAGVTEIECRNVGYNPRTIVLVDGVNKYDIVLDPSSVVLSDVVVTGYQAIERRKLTAAITKMEVDENKIGSIMNIDQALAGQVAGLSAIQSSGSPGAPLKIRIRGTSSLQGTQDPLWVRHVEFVKLLKGKEAIHHRSRIITYVDVRKRKLISLLTNDMESDQEEIIAIYRQRWEIELLFKQMSQNFPLRCFYGESANAIKIQILVTLIANLLMVM